LVDPGAYARYLRAKYLKRQFTPDSLDQSAKLYKQALEIDPSYAPAWQELADVYRALGDKGLRPIEESYVNAREALAKALVEDPDYGPTHATLGSIALTYDLDFTAAATHLQRALELEPANTEILAKAAMLPYVLGREEQAIRLRELVAARDPLWAKAHYNLGMQYCIAGRLDQAVAELQKAVELSAELVGARSMLGIAMAEKDDPSAVGIAQQERFEPFRLLALAMVYHRLGQPGESDSALKEMIGKHGKDWPYNIAYVYAFRGERDHAFDWLNQAVERHDTGLGEIAGNSFFANLRGDPRWLPFLTKIGKAPDQLAAIKFDVTVPK
jgi:tetratricopeptide (TPR) repeat protein